MLFLYFAGALCLGRVPLFLREIYVVISNQAHPTHVFTIDKPDIGNPRAFTITLRELSEDMIEDQLFAIAESYNKGIVLSNKNRNLRSLPFYDKIEVAKPANPMHEKPMYIKMDRSKYPDTFRIIYDGKCLATAPYVFEENVYTVKFVECLEQENQLWGAFTSTRATTLLKKIKDYEDYEVTTLRRLVRRIHRDGRKVLEIKNH